MSTIRRQRNDDSRDTSRAGFMSHALGFGVTRCHHIPADRQACNGRQDLQARRCLTHVSPCITGGSFGSRLLFHLRSARALSSQSVEPRQRVGAVLPPRTRLAATFNLCAALLIGRSHQLNRIAHKLGGDRPNPFHRHSFALSHEQTCRAKELEPCSLIQGKRLPQ